MEKVLACSNDPVEACLGFLERHPEDLIVLAVRQQKGHMRWLQKSVGKPLARAAGQMTLFIPHGIEGFGFVSRQDGSISLRNILIPVTSKPRPQPRVANLYSHRSQGCIPREPAAGTASASAASGSVMKEIGGMLNLTTRTVAFHKYRLMEVLGARSNAELVRYAVRNHMIDA